MKKACAIALFFALTTFAVAETPKSATIYIAPTGDGFDMYLAAAITKKKVPVSVMDKLENASLTLRVAAIETHKESTGSKVARCLFAYCIGIEDSSNTSVQLLDKDGKLLWAYSVNKGHGQKNRQSMAEAIAKHLKNDYFHDKS